MSFRTVVITNKSRLSYKNHYLMVKNELNDTYIHLSEIDTLIIDSMGSTMSTYLLKELLDHKINVIFCNDKHNPFGEISSLYSRFDNSKQILRQVKWTLNQKNKIWEEIVKNKILNQALTIININYQNYNLLLKYINEIKDADKSNREGHAAKVYFNTLFGKKFTRNQDNDINSALNYGYAILLSTINKEVIINGYITQIGIHHKNEYNKYNLSCDLMEPFRIIIDKFVYENKGEEFDSNMKIKIIDIFNHEYIYNNKKYTLKDIIKYYVRDVLLAIDEEKEYKGFIINEE